MKKRIPFGVLVCCLALICLLSQGIDILITKGDMTYRLWTRMRPHAPLDLTEVVPDGLTSYSYESLCEREDVQILTTMMLVNASHPLPADYVAVLQEYNGARMHPEMVAPYVALRDEVQAKTGIRIYVASDFRTREEQEAILAESGGDVAAQVGCSEHEAGLALDVYAPYFGGESFLKSSAGRLVNEICSRYGFIVRYPLGREDVTGITYEPWHLRYVGEPHAKLISESGLTLEEYLQALEMGKWYRTGEYLISRQSMDQIALPEAWQGCQISPDNTGCAIITIKMI